MAIINGTNGADSLYGSGGADQINGFGGNDTLKGFGGADRLDGGAGIDTVFYGDSNVGVSVNLQSGRGYLGSAEGDTYFSIENVYGSSYNDTVTGTSGNNELYGLDGSDVLKGGGGDDYLSGGSGDDILQAGGFSGTSTLDGGSGNDTFKGIGGADTLIGGSGIDTVDYSDRTFGVTVSLGDPIPYWAGTPTPHGLFSSIENLTGSQGHDVLVGDGNSNVLRGLDGNDNLIGGGGADTMYGGTGNDHYYVDNAGDIVRENAGEGTSDVVWTSVSYGLTAGAEIEQFNTIDTRGTAPINLTGNELTNYISGNYGDNIISGGPGADRMYGWKGNDTYFVENPGDTLFENYGEGVDTVYTSVSFDVGLYSEIEVLQATGSGNIGLVGSIDNNTIIGNSGSNIIIGSYGKDTLTGGGGPDAFLWNAVDEIGLFNFDPDIVTDMNRAEGDVLHLNNMDADETVAGNQNFTFIGSAAFTAPGQISVTTDGIDTFIQLNTNADLTVDGIIQVRGVHVVDASWFVL